MKTKKNLLVLLSICSLGFTTLITSCDKKPPVDESSSQEEQAEVLGVVLNHDEVNMLIGDEITLEATVAPANATTTLSWESDDPTVATVDSNGKVVALSEGVAIITVKTANGKDASCGINVTKPLGEALFTDTMHFIEGKDCNISIYEDTFQLSGFASNGELSLDFTAESMGWSVVDNTFTPAPGSKVVAIGLDFPLLVDTGFKDGGYQIRFYVNNGTADFEIGTYLLSSDEASTLGIDTNVTYEVAKATSKNEGYISLMSDGTCSLYGKFMGAVEVRTESTWELKDGVITISDAVAETAFGPFTVKTTVLAQGNLNFSMDLVENEGHLDTVVIPYTSAIELFPTIELSYESVTQIVVDESILLGKTIVSGEQFDLSTCLSVLPENATDKTLTFTAENSAVAAVTANNTIEGYKQGTAKITVTAADKDSLGNPISVDVLFNVTYPEKGETFASANTFDKVSLYRGVIDFGVLKIKRDYIFYPDGTVMAYQTTSEDKNGYEGAMAAVGYYSVEEDKIIYKAFNEAEVAEYVFSNEKENFTVNADGIISEYTLVDLTAFAEEKTFQMELDLSAYIGLPAGSYVLINELVFKTDGSVLYSQYTKGQEALKVQQTATYDYSDNKVTVFDAAGDFNFALKDVVDVEGALQFNIGNDLLPLYYIELLDE